MHIEGEKRFAAPPEDVYRALTDPEEIGRAFSAIERVEADGADWTLVVRLPGGFRPGFSVRVEEQREPEHARLRASAKRFGSRISVDTSFDLAPDNEGTLMRWRAEIEGSGIFTALGRQALAPVAKQHADRALERLVRQPVG